MRTWAKSWWVLALGASSVLATPAQEAGQQLPVRPLGMVGPTPTAAMQTDIDKDTTRHFGDAPRDPGALARMSPALQAPAIDAVTRKVADWELARGESYFDQIWTSSVLYTGYMAAAQSTGDARYSEAMIRVTAKYNAGFRSALPNADDLSIAQMYAELYLRGHRSPEAEKLIAPTRSVLEQLLPLKTLKPGDPRPPWWWCDALFMAPPVWARMYAATNDRRYIEYLDAQWAATSSLLYDEHDHLYARDASFIGKRGPGGQKIFWSRGEGWVMAGLARTLEYLPADDTHRSFYAGQLQAMSSRIAALQDAGGEWHASLLDPEHFPAAETSGGALFVYAMAWGVNHGVLDRAVYLPVITRAWGALVTQHVYADGRFGGVQQTGAEPAYFLPSSSYDYGVGAFLLAGSELKVLVQTAAAKPDAAATTDPAVYAKLNLPTPANPKLRDLILVGDSTVRNGRGDGAHNQMGWGDELSKYLDTARINVVNRAIGGRSSRTYITEGHFGETLKLVKSGDVVLIQFGHNDSGAIDDPARARASLPGDGDETRTIANPITHKQEVVHTFGWYLAEYVRDVRAKGATPVLCSLVPRKLWRDGHVERQTSTYRGWTAEVAQSLHVDYIDLNEIVGEAYDSLGEAAVEPLFGDPHTHTTAAGATLNAQAVIAGLKSLHPDPVGGYLSAAGEAVKASPVR